MSKRRVVKGCGIGCGGVIALLAVVAVVLMIWKPWAPEIVVSDPSTGGTRVTENGLLGNYYPAAGGTKAPGVLVLGGSEGGLSGGADRAAKELAAQGFSALALSYWGGPGQEPRMEKLPLETFDTALTWLQKQPGVEPGRLAVLGASKGGEAAVLLGSRNPAVKATVGYVPSHVVWQGFDQAEPWRIAMGMDSTWTAGGSPVPAVPYTNNFRGGDTVELYRMSLQENLAGHQDAVIPVEKAAGPMMLVCGGKDTMWPSCDMARAVKDRASAKNGPEVTLAEYPEAGHMIFGPPITQDSSFWNQLGMFGGTPEINNQAAAESWPKVLTFLRESLVS